MCKAFVEVINGNIIGIKGKYKKGHWVFCSECGELKVKKMRKYKSVAGLKRALKKRNGGKNV